MLLPPLLRCSLSTATDSIFDMDGHNFKIHRVFDSLNNFLMIYFDVDVDEPLKFHLIPPSRQFPNFYVFDNKDFFFSIFKILIILKIYIKYINFKKLLNVRVMHAIS